MKCVMGTIAGLLMAGAALADEVHLTSGRVIVGIARREPGSVVVETGLGTLTYPADKVSSIVPGKTTLHEYRERLAALGSSPKANDVFALSEWARQQGLIRYVNQLLRWTLALDPNHQQARQQLDYVFFEGRWIPWHERQHLLMTQAEQVGPGGNLRLRPARIPRHPLPEMSSGYVYLGIPPGPPRRGTQNHGYDWPLVAITGGTPSMR